MIVENIAERLFVDLKNLETKIEKPEYVIDGAKIGQVSSIKGVISSPAQQFTIFGVKHGKEYKYNFGKGFNFNSTEEEWVTFTEAYLEFLEAIKSLGSNLKFYNLTIPRKGVIDVKLEEFETVVVRYIKDYLPQSDELVWRWDVLISSAATFKI